MLKRLLYSKIFDDLILNSKTTFIDIPKLQLYHLLHLLFSYVTKYEIKSQSQLISSKLHLNYFDQSCIVQKQTYNDESSL